MCASQCLQPQRRFHSSMGTAVSKRKNLRTDAISSVAAKVRAARAFGEYLSHSNPENHNGSDHLLSDTLVVQDSESPDAACPHGNSLRPQPRPSQAVQPSPEKEEQPGNSQLKASLRRPLPLDRSFSIEEQQEKRPEGTVQSPRVYTITGEGGMLGDRGSEESLELEVLKGSQEAEPPSSQTPALANSALQQGRGHHRPTHNRPTHHRSHHHHHGNQPSQPLQSSGSTHNIREWAVRRAGSREEQSPDCEACCRPPSHSQRSLDLDSCPRDGGRQRRKLERMYSEDRVSAEEREDAVNSWFPKENMFNFQTATTTMQAISNFRKHLRMVGSRRMKVQSGDLQSSSGALNEEICEDLDWEQEREVEKADCQGDDFIPPKIMLISSKVPKAEYIPNIIRRDDSSIIPILYDHERATFDDILEEIDKKLTAYRRGCKIWKMLIFCQGGPGHLYLLKNKVATFAKVVKEEDMINFWRRLSRMMSKLNPEPNLIHVMGCYVLGNANGEKLFQNLKNLMKPYSVEFKSPLELSAQGKEMIEIYFDFRLFRLWKARQHSKLLDYDDLM
ncbi:NMDA receptor synaptonuclear signaling and neuronal migration factor-like [Brienomyrus brachyistius]|uniref:NMDA receptor synaptonuclear signaling and neuronal migration factor-like n=1 Tax=Brienomyrus brachyistius TaxID=42636 RepID=UPI0020B3B63C|nr:NMDA receptor synaptonuclear signaling and neuronal migration factor-like [Brienomyrus brachyistius]